MVDPRCSVDGFDDVQDLHEKPVVLVGIDDEPSKNDTAKGA